MGLNLRRRKKIFNPHTFYISFFIAPLKSHLIENTRKNYDSSSR